MRKLSSKLTLKDCLIIHLERSLERKSQVRKLETWLQEKNEQILALREYIETLETQIKRQRPVKNG